MATIEEIKLLNQVVVVVANNQWFKLAVLLGVPIDTSVEKMHEIFNEKFKELLEIN